MQHNSLLEMWLSWSEKFNYIKYLNLFVHFQAKFCVNKKAKAGNRWTPRTSLNLRVNDLSELWLSS